MVELVPPHPPSATPFSPASTPWLALRTRIATVGVAPSRAAYCSLSVGGGYVWRFGGLSDGHCLNTLHALPLSCLLEPQGHSYAGQWLEPQASGPPPSERMGHSSVWVEGKGGGGGCLVVAGGSDGTDLLRDGRELHDVHILTVTVPPPNSPQPGPLGLSWSVVQQDPPRTALGRTHSAHLTGSHNTPHPMTLQTSQARPRLMLPLPVCVLCVWVSRQWDDPVLRGLCSPVAVPCRPHTPAPSGPL